MLGDFQIGVLWDAWLSAETRSQYFGALVNRYQFRQKALVVASLLLSSGATLTLLTAVLPPHLAWVRPTLTVLAGAFSLWSLVAKNERNAIDCSDLHFRWNVLAMDYEDLWANVHGDDAVDRLAVLRKREAELSKSSTTMPFNERLLGKMQDNVMMHHKVETSG